MNEYLRVLKNKTNIFSQDLNSIESTKATNVKKMKKSNRNFCGMRFEVIYVKIIFAHENHSKNNERRIF